MSKLRTGVGEYSSPMDRIESGRAMVMILREPVSVTVGGVRKKITGHEALLRQTYLKAMKGDAAARRDVIELARLGYDAEKNAYIDLLNFR